MEDLEYEWESTGLYWSVLVSHYFSASWTDWPNPIVLKDQRRTLSLGFIGVNSTDLLVTCVKTKVSGLRQGQLLMSKDKAKVLFLSQLIECKRTSFPKELPLVFMWHSRLVMSGQYGTKASLSQVVQIIMQFYTDLKKFNQMHK